MAKDTRHGGARKRAKLRKAAEAPATKEPKALPPPRWPFPLGPRP
ncbi:MAG TPA: hypothetical protein VJ001_02120 [Rhodocyclaceae bacterium]|nr:hypothetical protein [Rhodocyclaceae bacterium]